MMEDTSKDGDESNTTDPEVPKKGRKKKRNKKSSQEPQEKVREDPGDALALDSYEKFCQLISSKKKRDILIQEVTLMSNWDDNEKLGRLCASLENSFFELAQEIVKTTRVNVNRHVDCKYPLCFALRNGNCSFEIVELIIKAGFPANAIVDKRLNSTGLHEAVNMGKYEIAEQLLKLSVDPNAKDIKGLTPLHYACLNSNLKLITLLVKSGADVNMSCDRNFPSLFRAISAKNYNSVKLLLSLGADCDMFWSEGETSLAPIHFAARNCDAELIKLLVSRGVNVNALVPATGKTALHMALDALKPGLPGRFEFVKTFQILVSSGADVNVKDNSGNSLVDLALKGGLVFVIESLIENNLSLNTDRTFFKIMLSYDRIMIRLCLQYGADYLMRSSSGAYCLTVALSTRCISTVIFNDYDQRLNYDIKKVVIGIAKLFWRSGFPVESTLANVSEDFHPIPSLLTLTNVQMDLLKAVKSLDAKLLIESIRKGADVMVCGEEVTHPLHYLAEKGNNLCVQIFLSRTVKVNALQDGGPTPLHLAAKSGNLSCCRMLLEKGAIYNYKSEKCPETPYQLAKQCEKSEVRDLFKYIASTFKHLKEKGKLRKVKGFNFKAIMNCRDRSGKTLLETALTLGKMEVAERLMRLRLKHL